MTTTEVFVEYDWRDGATRTDGTEHWTRVPTIGETVHLIEETPEYRRAAFWRVESVTWHTGHARPTLRIVPEMT